MNDKRNELAAMAMAALVSELVPQTKAECMNIAACSYRMADAMIAHKKGYWSGPPEPVIV
jgi:hypothetical protein